MDDLKAGDMVAAETGEVFEYLRPAEDGKGIYVIVRNSSGAERILFGPTLMRLPKPKPRKKPCAPSEPSQS